MELEEFLRRVPVLQQVASFHQEIDKLARRAFVSDLTGLPNKTALEEIGKLYDHELKTEVAVAFLDLAGFKHVNDAYGHFAGDVALRKVAAELKRLAAGGAVYPFHSGGDEFVVVAIPSDMPRFLDGATEALTRADIRVEFQGKHIGGLRATIGFAPAEQGASLMTLVQRAEAAMRAAKLANSAAPVQWTKEVQDNPTDTPRRRCQHCGATTTVQVLASRRMPAALTKCANCDRELGA